MADRVDEELLGYLLDALDDDRCEEIEEQLGRDAQLRQRLIALRDKLRPLRQADLDVEPPEGLAARTCAAVAALAAERAAGSKMGASRRAARRRFDAAMIAAVEQTAEPASRPMPLVAELPVPPAASSSWRWADLAVTLGILAASALLVIPAIEGSRSNARLAACQQNLRDLGQALTHYSAAHAGYFPVLPQRGPMAVAGAYAPMLLEGGYLSDSQAVVCPGSSLAERNDFRVPSSHELLAANAGPRLAAMQGTMGGSYGYSLGYTQSGRYLGTFNLNRSAYALMADAPRRSSDALGSPNHDGRGQNVLFEDGHVEFLAGSEPAARGDHYFLNDGGQVAAGRHRDDAVIGSSASMPVRFVENR